MKTSALIAVLAVLIFAPRQVMARSWGSYQHDPAHTGRTNASVDPATLALAWTASGYERPVIVEDKLYARRNNDFSTDATAFSLADGTVLWTYSGPNVYGGNVSVAGSFAILEGYDLSQSKGTLTALDRESGEFLYTIDLPLTQSLVDPAVVHNRATGAIHAYWANETTIVGVALHRDRARVIWARSEDLGFLCFPAIVGDSVINFGPFKGCAFDQRTGAENVFYTSSVSCGPSSAVSYNAERSDFYVRLDRETTDLLAFHYEDNDSIQLLWTRSTPFSQLSGGVALGENGNIYIVAGDELAIVDPNDGSTIQSVPFPYSNGATVALSRGVLWVDSEFQTLAFDAASLVYLRGIDGGTNFLSGWESPGAFAPATAALNAAAAGFRELDVYRGAAAGR